MAQGARPSIPLQPLSTPFPVPAPFPPGFALRPALKALPDGVHYRTLNEPLSTLGSGDTSPFAPNDIAQGQLGDCYFISAATAIALHRPEILREMITPGEQGVLKVRFYQWTPQGLEPYWVPIDSKVPIDTKTGKPAYAYAGGEEELWPMLIEKAWAAKAGSYSAVEGGDGGEAMEQISGVPSRDYNPKQVTIEQMAAFAEQDAAMTAATRRAWKIEIPRLNLRFGPGTDPLFASGKLVSNHEYYVLDVDPAKGTIRLGNPWGWGKEVTLTFDEFRRAFTRLSVNELQP